MSTMKRAMALSVTPPYLRNAGGPQPGLVHTAYPAPTSDPEFRTGGLDSNPLLPIQHTFRTKTVRSIETPKSKGGETMSNNPNWPSTKPGHPSGGGRGNNGPRK